MIWEPMAFGFQIMAVEHLESDITALEVIEEIKSVIPKKLKNHC